jgi:SNF2 family DNA or RNA helicase
MQLSEADQQRFEHYLSRAELDTKNYQFEGLAWLLERERNGYVVDDTVIRGGLLADEMGLGKTIQIIATILCNPKQNTLIVVPRALLEQWETVIYRTTGHSALIFHGGERIEYSKEDLERRPVIITTYSLAAAGCSGKRKKDDPGPKGGDKGNILHRITWDRVVFDEAHHLRNDHTRAFAGAKKLSAKIRWLVTGTPIQNRKKDFYSLCAQMGLSDKYYTDNGNLMDLVRKFILKRTKADVNIQLPDLHYSMTHVAWNSEAEKKLAENIHELLQFSRVNKNYVDNTICHLDMPTLVLLVRARQVCIYPNLIKSQMDHYSKYGLINDEDKAIRNGLMGTSKLDAVCNKIISRKDNGNAKLVFCHYRGEIDIIRWQLVREEISVEVFDGRVKENDRKRILESTCDVLILQINTGCEGLNLQQFNEIYFVSPHWNPAVEDQATARCHRIGQQKSIEVFRFMMTGFDSKNETTTLDQYSSAVQEVKREVMTILDEEVEDESS